ncbi:MAG TPA: GNAT family N-acetyltransferase [Streptosporangiaceae bacterium]|nr:GNAT family N-acetyltransferase [Streptosporangiaceae bacterium]
MTAADQAPRHATETDLAAITSVIAAAYARYLDRMDRPAAPVLADYRGAIAAGQVWVTGEPVTAVLVLVPQHDAMLIDNVAVAPAEQGTGLGRRLMEFAEEQAMASGLRRMTLYTNEVMTENLAIYARLGYRETARHCQDGYRRVFMEKNLPG